MLIQFYFFFENTKEVKNFFNPKLNYSFLDIFNYFSKEILYVLLKKKRILQKLNKKNVKAINLE